LQPTLGFKPVNFIILHRAAAEPAFGGIA
jgi:hypothetical protein